MALEDRCNGAQSGTSPRDLAMITLCDERERAPTPRLPGKSCGRKALIMAEREISERQRQWLVGELTVWQALGVVTEPQTTEILDLYGTTEQRAERRGARAMF